MMFSVTQLSNGNCMLLVTDTPLQQAAAAAALLMDLHCSQAGWQGVAT